MDSATVTFGPEGGIESEREMGPLLPGVLCGFGENGLPMAEPDGGAVTTVRASDREVGSGAGIG